MASLTLLHGGERTPHDLAPGRYVLGRHPDCDIKLASNMISRRHAEVVHTADGTTIADMGSGNGTFVNGKPIDQSPYLLQHGDRVKLGPLLFQYEGDGAAPPESKRTDVAMPAFDRTVGLDVDESDATSTIMGSVESAIGQRLLDVQPEKKLKAVLDISRALARTLDVNAVFPNILQELFDIFPAADRGAIFLRQAGSEKMVLHSVKFRRESDDDSFRMSRTVLRKVLSDKESILSADATGDDRFSGSESITNLTIRSMMCTPLLNTDSEPIGLIHVDTQNPMQRFRQDDLEILVVVGMLASLSYESRAWFESALEKEKQDNEMAIAKEVQRALLPDVLPTVEAYEFFASYEAAQAVGGDYYDITVMKDGRVCIAFGDVAGKGVPASLVMSRLSSAVRFTTEFMTDIIDAVGKINEHMCAKAVEGRFVTFVLVLLDPRQHRISVVNAGHMPLMIRRADGTIEEFGQEQIGLPIGVIEDFAFESVERELRPGETVLIYTDGVSEAMNPQGDLYGVERLKTVVAGADASPDELGKRVRDDVRRHANGRAQNDDITMLSFGRLPE